MANNLLTGIDWGTKVHAKFIGYYYVPSGETHLTGLGEFTSIGWLDYEKAAFRKAFDLYSSFLNVHFLEVDGAGKANFNLMSFAGTNPLGVMNPPGYGKPVGFGAFNLVGQGWGQVGLQQGGFGFITVIHELGHGLGLAHPHDKGGTSTVFPGVHESDDTGLYDLNQGVYTTMSYVDGWNTNPDGLPPEFGAYGFQGSPMALDIAVLQKKYGVNNAYHTGNDTYYLPAANQPGTFYSCIWDAGGTDTMAAFGSAAAYIDLRAATLRLEPGGGGFISHVDQILGGFTIAHGVVIENARGADGADFLHGNGASNLLLGERGDDTIIAGGGHDTLAGGWGGDTLDGGQGRDVVKGGFGNDTLTGGGGFDRFVFDTALDRFKNVDHIADFRPGIDRIVLSADDFRDLGGRGALAAGRFHVGAAAADGNDRIIYDPATGDLFYDRDGTGSRHQQLFATLAPGLSLGHGDFLVVA